MTSKTGNQYLPTEVSPPGGSLGDLLHEHRMSQVELAARTGKSSKHVSEVLSGAAPISAEFALALERVLLVPAGFWLAREAGYREYKARLRAAESASRHIKWAEAFPVKDLRLHKLIPSDSKGEALVEAMLRFFGIASPDEFEVMSKALQPSFRRSRSFSGDWQALAAWLRWGELQATQLITAKYYEASFRELLPELRKLSLLSAAEFVGQLRHLCADAGVAVVFVPELKGTHASGATRWLNPDKALIQLSLRYKTDDVLWFSFFHEACHILRHSKKATFIDDTGHDDDALEASAVRDFAAQQGIAPGIVVGRLQHDEILPRDHLNGLKRRLEWSQPA
jgi:HTH-type transcriptional regulator / antitoxin HigA